MRKEFLLGTIRGELLLQKQLFPLTELNIYTKKIQWNPSTPDYDINTFGKLLKEEAVYSSNGIIKSRPKYHHGFYMNLKCTEEFYNKYKRILDEHIITNPNILNNSYPPKWL